MALDRLLKAYPLVVLFQIEYLALHNNHRRILYVGKLKFQKLTATNCIFPDVLDIYVTFGIVYPIIVVVRRSYLLPGLAVLVILILVYLAGVV